MGNLRTYEPGKWIGVSQHDLPLIMLTSEHVRRTIQKRNWLRTTIEPRHMPLDSDAAGQVGAHPTADELVSAVATSAGVSGRGATEPRRDRLRGR